jgi:hypothetical protein
MPAGEQTRYAIERWNVQLAVSGRDFLRATTTAQAANPPRIFANPDYDLEPGEAVAVLDAMLRGIGIAPPETAATKNEPAAARFHLRGVGLGPVRLPGTAAEARSIAPQLSRFAGDRAMNDSPEAALPCAG